MNTIKCAWCGATIRTDSPVESSHGICEECKKRLLEEAKEYGHNDNNRNTMPLF